MENKTDKGQDNLRCNLTDEELLAYGKRQAQLLSDRAKADDELDAFKSGIKNRLAVIDGEVNGISEKIRNGYEFRFVPTTIVTDWGADLVRFFRDDTGVEYSTRPLNAEQRQLKLEMQEKEQKAAEKKTEK